MGQHSLLLSAQLAYFHQHSVQGKTSLGTLQERIKDTNRKRDCTLPGFIKSELCQKNLIRYQRKLIGFPGKGNTLIYLAISKAFDMMPHEKLFVQWWMTGLGRRTVSVQRPG